MKQQPQSKIRWSPGTSIVFDNEDSGESVTVTMKPNRSFYGDAEDYDFVAKDEHELMTKLKKFGFNLKPVGYENMKEETLKEGPEWGAESAAAYKAVTPGQENAEQVPKTEETPTPDQIQKLVDIVAKRIMGLKESIVRYGTDWNTIAHFLDLYEEKGIDYLVEVCHILDKRKGKRLRDVVEAKEIEEETNPDEFMEEEAVGEEYDRKMDGDAAHIHVRHDPKGVKYRSKKEYSAALKDHKIDHYVANSHYKDHVRFTVAKKHQKKAEDILLGEE